MHLYKLLLRIQRIQRPFESVSMVLIIKGLLVVIVVNHICPLFLLAHTHINQDAHSKLEDHYDDENVWVSALFETGY